MCIDLRRIDEKIRELYHQDSHIESFLEQIVAQDARDIDSEKRAIRSAAVYGDSERVAKFMQLVFIRTLAMRPVDGEAWALAALEHMDMDPSLYMKISGYCSSCDTAEQKCKKCEQDEIKDAVRDLDT